MIPASTFPSTEVRSFNPKNVLGPICSGCTPRLSLIWGSTLRRLSFLQEDWSWLGEAVPRRKGERFNQKLATYLTDMLTGSQPAATAYGARDGTP